jgi:hypothetical protein
VHIVHILKVRIRGNLVVIIVSSAATLHEGSEHETSDCIDAQPRITTTLVMYDEANQP